MSNTQPVLPVLLVVALMGSAEPAQKPTPEELVTRHLAQLSGASGQPTRVGEVSGTCRMSSALDPVPVEGTFAIGTQGETSRLLVQFRSNVYEGEAIGFDGKQVHVGFAQPKLNARSALGMYLALNKVIVAEGLLGGVLSGRWPLASLAAREAKLSYEGIKKLEGRELHRVRYRAKRDQGDLSILLYFEPESYRHVASTFSSSRPQRPDFTASRSAGEADQFFTLDERFSDFETRDGMTVPTTWLLRYARTAASTTEWTYQFKVGSFSPRESPLATDTSSSGRFDGSRP